MTPCKIWDGPVSHGYGQRGKRRAHRIAYEDAYGPIPEGLGVLHRCDVKLCVEPTHLFLGTQRDNLNDMRAKGRDRNNSPEAVAKRRPKLQALRPVRDAKGRFAPK